MNTASLGLKENLGQFSLLILVNAFVGGMVGLERSILPQLAATDFHISSKTAILTFIVVFGTVKALSNYYAGKWADRLGRKNILLIGWLFALPVPFILMVAENWNWILFANALLGINQGLAWSSTVVMKIDLVGEKNRGLAMGLNEFAGYLAVALVAFLTGWVAGEFGLRPYPFYIGIGLSFAGLFITWFFIKDTLHHVAAETSSSNLPRLKRVFWETSLYHKNLGSVTQAGLINNLNDGMAWGLFPIVLNQKGFDLPQIALVTAAYPAVWGIGQLITGKLSDHVCKKRLLFWGMLLQGVALLLFAFANMFTQYLLLAMVLGWGTAMVYPTFLATIAENTHPLDRAKSIGVFRLWRDLGYAIGALLTGFIADVFGINTSVLVIAGLTLFSSLVIEKRMRCKTHSSTLFDWLLKKIQIMVFPKNTNNACRAETLA